MARNIRGVRRFSDRDIDAIDIGPIEPPTPAEAWVEVVENFADLLQLANRSDRRKARRLMAELEGEAIDVFKIANMLDDPDWIPKDWGKVRRKHGRNKLVERLLDDGNKARAFTMRQLDLAGLGDLQARLDRTNWWKQGALLLDCIEHLRRKLVLFEWELNRIIGERRRARGSERTGRPPSVAWNYLIGQQEQFGFSDESVMRSVLSLFKIVDDETNRRTVQDNIRKHRERRQRRG